MRHRYTAFGLVVESDIELPSLRALPTRGRASPSVHIRAGHPPETLASPRRRTRFYQAAAGALLLNVRAIARYFVRDGVEIVYQRQPEASDDDVRAFMLTTAMGALLLQRGLLVLHASAIETPTGAVAFCGDSGAGKSTLATALNQRGHRLVTDDLCAVTLDADGRAMALPAYRRVKLWADTVQRLAIEGDLRPVRPAIEKYEYDAGDAFADAPVPLRRVYTLTEVNADKVGIAPLSGFEKLKELTRHTYRSNFLDGLGVRESHFRLANSVAAQVECRTVSRPRGVFRLRALVNAIEADL